MPITQCSTIAIPGKFVRVIDENIVIQVLDITDNVVRGIAEYPVGDVIYPNERDLFSKARKPRNFPDYSDRIVAAPEPRPELRQPAKGKSKERRETKYANFLELMRNTPDLSRKAAIGLMQEQDPEISVSLCSTYYYKAKKQLEL